MGATIVEVLKVVGGNVLRLLPSLAVAVPVAVYLNHANIDDQVRTVLNRGPILSVFLATLIGALRPLCSCGVIPVVAALLAGEMPLAPVMSFWLASPSMDPEILLMSGATIGWELAIWRLAATFVMSFGAGLVVMILERRGVFSSGVLRSEPSRQPDIAMPEPVPALAMAGGPSDLQVSHATDTTIARPAGTGGVGVEQRSEREIRGLTFSKLKQYGNEALRVAARLLERGMDPAAALSFFVAGAVTTIPAIAAVAGIVRLRVFGLYLGFAVVGALASGYVWKLVHAF